MDPISDAEKIRNKRLAKLGNSSAAPSSTTPSSSSSEQVTSASVAQPVANPPPSITQPTPKVATSNSTPTPLVSKPKPKPVAATESLELWTDRTLSSIFRITLQPNPKQDGGQRISYLQDLRSELEESGSEVRLTPEILDGAIIEAASTQDGKALPYLLGCWKRVTKVWRNTRGAGADERKLEVLKEAKRLCMSHCIFAVTMPEMYGGEETTQSPLLDHFLRDPESDSGICHDFLAEAVSRFPEDESIKQALVGAAEQLSAELRKLTMNDNFKPYVAALRTLARYQPIVLAITESPLFLPENLEPQDIENNTLLGPFFALSPLHESVADNYFRGAQAQGEAFVQSNQNSVRLTLRTHQDELFDITNCIIKAAKESRERLLDWFAMIVNKNHKRRAMYVDKATVSSHGFMINVTTILDRLCEPFMDATFSKLDRIDVNYLRRNSRVDIEDETKLNADEATSKEFYAQKAGGENNFISEVFFLTLAAHHYGTDSANKQVTQMQREIKHLEQQIDKFAAERYKYIANPAQLAVFEQHHKRYKDTLDKAKSTLKALQGVLLDELTQSRSMLLMRYVIAWLLRLLQPNSRYPQKQITLPLADEQPDVFRCLPEYFVEDIVDNFKFVTNQMPHILPSTQCEELVTVCVTFLRNSEYIKNPGIKSGLVSILFHGIWPVRNRAKGVLGDLLNSSEFCHKHLLHALMKFYIEAESTGAHTAFYDKFNIRYEIFQVIRCIWPNSIYREKLDSESKQNVEFFVRFVNLLLNDVTYVLGESFSAFNRINILQNELEQVPSTLTDEERDQKKSELSDQQNKAKGNMQLTNETVSMLKLFTEVLAPAFTMPEIVQRLADMLDYNLEAMVGPKQKNLKVKDPDQYYFKPKSLLSDLVSVYINLKDQSSFHAAVARDGRSYKPYNFKHAAEILGTTKSPEELKVWHKLADTIAKVKEAEDQAEDDLGEIPDEFMDPLLDTLMEDPVTLPTSKQTLDRSTIRTHLLSDPHDPFNRAPLKIEDVIPNTELKAQIEQFKADARKRKLEAIQQASEGAHGEDEMDLS